MNGQSPNHTTPQDDDALPVPEFEQLYLTFGPSVLRYLSSKVFHLEDAEDLAAETWRKALAHFDR